MKGPTMMNCDGSGRMILHMRQDGRTMCNACGRLLQVSPKKDTVPNHKPDGLSR